jgi:hypothetical protein
MIGELPRKSIVSRMSSKTRLCAWNAGNIRMGAQKPALPHLPPDGEGLLSVQISGFKGYDVARVRVPE